MDDRSARRASLGLVKKEDQRTSSGVVPAQGGDATSPSIGPGVILDGKYLVGRIVGAGAVGIVFEATNVELDEKVAIKCLRPEMLVDKAMVGRFAREAKAAAAIKSEYVATVHDVGTTPDGVPYMVMEYLDGKDLGMVVAESGTIGPRTAVEYALQVCEALAVAHSKGIVHRDIKPENLLLTERAGGMRIVKVLDFGISKAALTGSIFQNELPMVKTMNLMGTPLYMSPEQVRVSDSVDVRSDIWSLGMVIYEVLTGHTAFGGASITEICAAILEATPKPIELHRNDLPSGLVDVITKCLQKDVNRRFQNIAELALALMPFGPKRTRLNVERAVAVLQGAGQMDAGVRVNSTTPPSMADGHFAMTPIPRPPSVPGGMTPMAPVSSSGDPLMMRDSSEPSLSLPLAPFTPPTSSFGTGTGTSSLSANSSLTYIPEARKKPIGIILGVIAFLIIAVATATVMTTRTSTNAKDNNTTAAQPEPKATTAAASTTAAAATTTAAAAPTTPTATTTSTLETPPTSTSNVVAGTATTPIPSVKPLPAWATTTVGVRPTSTNGKPNPNGPKAKPKPGEEPDLGY